MAAGTKRARAGNKGHSASCKQVPQGGRGLWIDRELLRRHMNPLPKFVHSADPRERNDGSRYLELADTLLETRHHAKNTG